MSERPLLSVLMVSYNTRAILAEALTALEASTSPPTFETLVHDNASADASAAMVAERFPRVRLSRGEANLGFGRATNLLAREARGAWLLLLNSDAFVAPDCLARLAEAIAAADERTILVPRLLNADGSLQRGVRPEPSPGYLLREAVGLSRRDASAPEGELPAGWYASGAALAVPAGLWQELGGFDEAFYFYGEDADLARRARSRGARLRFLPEAVVTHLGGASTAALRPDAAVEGYRAAFLLIARHRGGLALACARGAVLLGSLARLAITLPARSEGSAERRASYRRVVRLCLRCAPFPTGRFGDG